jgi:hypothetical protein
MLALRMAAASLAKAASFKKPLGRGPLAHCRRDFSAEPRPAEHGPQQGLAHGEGALTPQVGRTQRAELPLGLKKGTLYLDREGGSTAF